MLEERSSPVRRLAVRLLGSFSLEFGGEPYRFAATTRASHLLAYLVLRPGERIGRSSLAAAFWPDEAGGDARANLRRHVHQIVRALPPEGAPWFAAGGATIEWPLRDDVWIDVAEFERAAGDPSRLEEAIALYRGDLLEECYEDWVLPDRERLRGLYLNACYELATGARRDRRFDDALAYVERILAADEWREDVVRLELAVRYESGDRTGALAAFSQFAQRLRAEMHVSPMPETIALRDAILANAALPGAPRSQADRAAQIRTPLVGRAMELESLDLAWSRAARGSGGTVFVGGDAGIGKSRLVGELAANVTAQGGRVLFGGTSNPEAFPYEPIVDALRSGLALLLESRVPESALARVAGILPELEAALGTQKAVPRAEPARERELLFDAIARSVDALARARPLLLVLEDLHWANAGTLEVLGVLARRVGALPALIVATYRTHEPDGRPGLGALRRALQSERRAVPCVLGALAPQEIDLLARSALGDAYDAQIGARIYEVSEGNPLFANQLLRGRLERGTTGTKSDAVRSIGEAILSRVDALDPQARALADTAAAIGRSFALETAARVLGWGEDETLDALGPLLDRGMVREAGGPSFIYTFTHALIANVIYEAAPAERRAMRHRRIAQVASAVGADDPSALAGVARHWELAGEAERAAPFFRQAAERAAAVYAYDESLEWSARALELSRDSEHRAQTLLVRETIHAARGAREEQQAELDALDALEREHADDALRWEIVRRRAALASVTDDLETGARLIEELRARAAAAGRERWRAEAEICAAEHAIASNDMALAQSCALEALRRCEACENRAGEIAALCLLARIAGDCGDLDATREHIERARHRAEPTDLAALAAATGAAAYAANHHQDFRALLELARASAELSRRIEDRYRHANALTLVAIAQTRLGGFAEARSVLQEVREVFEAMGRRYGVGATAINAGVLEWRLGRLEFAYQRFSDGIAVFRELANPGGALIGSINLAMLCARMGRFDEARASGRWALETARESGQVPQEASALLALGFADRENGEAQAAIELLERAVAMHRSVGRRVDVTEALGELALAYLEAGRLDDAQRAAKELAGSEADFASAMWPQLPRWTLARIYHAGGEERLAQRYLAAAAREVETLRAQIAASEDDAPFLAIAPNVAIARAVAENVWPEAAVRR